MADETTPEAVPDENGALVPPADAVTPPAELVWLRHHGVAHSVNVGSEAHKRLVADGAVPTEPTDADLEVTDFAMLEKAKADKKK